MGIFVGDKEKLRQILKGLQSQGKRIVLTNGVFDLLHVGHIRALKDARSRGDFLVVAINSDKSVKELKGADLPVNPFKERVELLNALECVDYVTVLKDKTADELLTFLRPDIHAKGTDYSSATVPERETVLAFGGTITIVGDAKSHSSSDILKKIGMLFAKKSASRSPSGSKSSKKASKSIKRGKNRKSSKKKKASSSRYASKKEKTVKPAQKKKVATKKRSGASSKKKARTSTSLEKKVRIKHKVSKKSRENKEMGTF